MVSPRLTPLVLLLLLALAAHRAAGSDWMEEPYGDDSFNTRAEFNTNVTLVCNDTASTADEALAFRYWIAPDLTVMNQSFHREFWTIDGWAGVWVSDDGHHLHAYLIQEAHFGFYYCVKEGNTGDAHIIKKAINYKGPYWGDLWAKYETNTIVGLSASGGFLAFCIMIGITMHFRYHDEEEEARKQNGDFRGIEEYGNSVPSRSDYLQNGGYTNQAFEPIKGVGFTPVSPIDVHLVTGKPVGTTGQTSMEF